MVCGRSRRTLAVLGLCGTLALSSGCSSAGAGGKGGSAGGSSGGPAVGGAGGGVNQGGAGGTNAESGGANTAGGGFGGTLNQGGGGQGGAQSTGPAGPVLPAFWNTQTMFEESAFFVRETDAEVANTQLLFVPDSVSAIQSIDGETTFQEGVDYTWSPDSRQLLLTADSGIPFKTFDETHPALGSPNSLPAANGESGLLWSEGAFFQGLQVKVTYAHSDVWNGPRPEFAGDDLPNTLAKLESQAPLQIVMLGDSISAGYNASGFIGVEPFQPAYIGLVADTLKAEYGGEVTLVNLAQAGQASGWGATMVSAVVAENPDLVVIAFGMNADASPEIFGDNVAATVNGIRESLPDAEFILVGTMAGNPEYAGGNFGFFAASRDQLSALVEPGVVLADVTGVWLEMTTTKKFVDLTGNGVNHPNDFGHRVYAQVITSLLLE
jgi:acyl-CoA thioesterase I